MGCSFVFQCHSLDGTGTVWHIFLSFKLNKPIYRVYNEHPNSDMSQLYLNACEQC